MTKSRCLLVCALLSACSGAGDEGASGGSGVDGGTGGDGGGSPGPAADASAEDAYVPDKGPPPDPTVLVHLTFDSPTDLKKVVVDEPTTHLTVADGALQVKSFTQHTAIVDSTPDGTPSDSFDLASGPLVVSMRVQSNSTPIVPSPALAPSVLPKAWIAFFPQSGRKQAPRITFNWSETGNDGFVFAQGSDLESSRALLAMQPEPKSLVTLTPMINDERFYEFRVTLTLARPGVVRAVASAYDRDRLVLRGDAEFVLTKTSGEIAFGGYADRSAPLVIDDFQIRRVAGDPPKEPAMTFSTSDPVHVWIPPGVQKVKGIYIESPGCCGDSNGVWDAREYLANFARAYDLAVLAHVTNQSPTLVEAGLRQLANASNHPELNTVPIVVYGFSAGSVWATRFANQFASRVVAFVADAYAMPAQVSAGAARAIPSIFTCGDSVDLVAVSDLVQSLESTRGQGAHQAFFAKERFSHLELGSYALYLPFFARALQARSPQGALPLLPVDENKAFLVQTLSGDDADKQKPSTMAQIFPAAGFTGDASKTGWLLDKATAYVAAAYGSYRRAVHITPIYDAKVGEARDAVVRVLPSMAAWSKIEIYDFANLVHTFMPGDAPLVFRYADLSQGVHALTAQLTLAGKTYVSFPQTFAVTPN
ncbi:MAG: hypothetical protein SF187_30400 [Deltaproteobacteria bacterium]|nr:hypothetical protein [Deltaproteobacteria bacterium]